MHTFDKDYWERHWRKAAGHSPADRLPVNPYLPAETASLAVGTALDAGCGTGTEALWLAEQGWQVTGTDISAAALSQARSQAVSAGLGGRLEWVQADLSQWEPERTSDLVVTSYAHPDSGQLTFYQRIASWVAPGGSVLIVGHRHSGHRHTGHRHTGHSHPDEATASLASVTALFADDQWQVEASYEQVRTVGAGARATQLHDVVVRARRRP